jgi:hypothetical protein
MTGEIVKETTCQDFPGKMFCNHTIQSKYGFIHSNLTT